MPTRVNIKSYALHKRYLGLTCRESRIIAKYNRELRQLTILHSILGNGTEQDDIEMLMHMMWIRRNYIVKEKIIYRAPFVSLHRTIDSFSDVEVPNLFRFRSRQQLSRLIVALQIPEKIILPSRNTCTGEELLLVELIRISSVSRLQDFEAIFGKSYTWISQVFTYFVIWIEKRHTWRLYNNLAFWVPHFSRFAESFRKKIEVLSDRALLYAEGTFRICMVTDCVNQLIRRPGTGPIVDGPNAGRADPTGWVQRVFYNGWLADCGIKYGTVDAPCGMTMFASAGESSRHSDLRWLSDSGINTKLEDAQLAHNGNINNDFF
jgi:hypothetical protein